MFKLTPKQLDRLKKASAQAAKTSSTVFSKWANCPIEIHMDGIESIPFPEVIPRSEPLDPVSFGLYLPITQDIQGSLLFLIKEETGYALVDSLMHRQPGTTNALGEMERSALMETCNIVGSAYLNGLVKELNLKKVIPGPPAIFHDITQSILESVIMEQNTTESEALLVHLDFKSSQETLQWKFFFMPRFQTLKGVL